MLLLLACAPDGDAPADETGAPAPIVQYLLGESQSADAAGRAIGEPSETLLRRTLTPADAGLEELVVSVDGDTAATFTVVGVIDADAGTWTFSFFDGYGTFEGEGEFLAGDPWAWTAWRSTSTYVDGDYAGSYVTSEDRLDGDAFAAHKEVFSPDDEREAQIDETLALVDADAWETRYAELTAR